VRVLREILTGKPVVTVDQDADTLQAARLMAERHVGAVLVVDRAGRPTGMFTERDLMTRVVVQCLAPQDALVRDHMTSDLYVATPDQRIDRIASDMRTRHIRHLPVVEDGRVLGMLSFRDLLYAHLRLAEGELEALTQYIQGNDAEQA